jgi:hypothetical protein
MNKNESNIYHAAFAAILASKKRNSALNILKNQVGFNVLCDLSENATKSHKPLNYQIFGTPKPSELNQIGKAEQPFKPQDLEKEIQWAFLSIRKYADVLSIFVIYKEEFEEAFLKGEYNKAEAKLEVIKNETGISLWYIEATFLLYEYTGQSKKQKEFLSEINEQNKLGVISTLAYFLNQRTERNLSAYKFDSDLHNFFYRSKSDYDNDIHQYYLFRLNYFEHNKIEDYAALVTFESFNSVVDRYLLIVGILKANAAQNKLLPFVYSRARYLYRKTKDRALLPLMLSHNPKALTNDFIDSEFLKILDFYYSGLYSEVIKECKNYFSSHRIHFDLIIIYCRSHINSKVKLELFPYENNSLINLLTKNTFELLTTNTKDHNSNFTLYQISKNLCSFNISAGLNNFLKLQKNSFSGSALALLSGNNFDPIFYKQFEEESSAIEYLELANSLHPGSLTITHHMKLLRNEEINEIGLSKERYLTDTAIQKFKKEEYDLSIEKWQTVVNEFKNNIPLTQVALSYWFSALVKKGEFNSALILYVDNYLINENSVTKIDSSELLKILRRKKYIGIERTIDLVIFVNLTCPVDNEKAYVLELFCRSLDKKLPSELFSLDISQSNEKLNLFYFMCCRQEILKHSIHINKTNDKLNERIFILNYLIELNQSNNKVFVEELNLITHELIIYEGTQKLDESKIYANDTAIIENELKDIDGLFNRFKTIAEIVKGSKKLLVIADNSFAMFTYDGNDSYKKSEVKYTDNALLEVFCELFDLILEKFLFSKFGIVAYLSTRIRHGVLLGEIRPELDKHNLILNTKGKGDEYEDMKHWSMPFFNLDSNQKTKLNTILKSFSKEIDKLITEIIKEKIQIKKDGDNEDGLFNYEFDKTELYQLAIELSEHKDSREFCKVIISKLWERTDYNLEVIRAYLQKDVKIKFGSLISQLEKEVSISIGNESLPQIFTSITECSTLLETKIDKISSWFRRSGSKIDDFDLSRVFEIVYKSTVKSYPKLNIEGNVNIAPVPLIKSEYYVHFTDFIRILIDNIFKYGGLINGKKVFDIYAQVTGNKLSLTFSNVKTEDFKEVHYYNLKSRQELDEEKIISEGKSGITKVIKIVRYDLGDESNEVIIDLEDPKKLIINCVINLNPIVVE